MSHEQLPETQAYSASSIQVLEFPESVRARPSMWIGGRDEDALHHMWEEAIANSVDEHMAEASCTEVTTIIHEDNSISVADNGRGIPVEEHPVEKKSTLEVVLATLHAGGKFDKNSYKVSGGLHGVGISCVNALSTYMKATVWRNGHMYHQEYARGKRLTDVTGQPDHSGHRGTTIYFSPDPEIFTTTIFDRTRIERRLQELAFLNQGLRLHLIDRREIVAGTDEPFQTTFYSAGGLPEFLAHLNKQHESIIDIVHVREEADPMPVEVVLSYNDTHREQIRSYVNNIHTPEGGTHVAGLKLALTKVFKDYAMKSGLVERTKLTLAPEDFREGLTAVISVKVAEPQFKGQTKSKLGNEEAQGVVNSCVRKELEHYLELHPAQGKKLVEKFLQAAKGRKLLQDLRESVQRKNALFSSSLPGKLADCSESDPSLCELYLVEGDSAGGTAKTARDRRTQAILPLRGKILNVEKAQEYKMYDNEQLKNIISALGIVFKPNEEGVNEISVESLRYHKVVIMTDADVDGSHIRTLLLTFFFRYMRPLIDRGHVYIAQPPLFLVKKGNEKQYCWDEENRDLAMTALSAGGNNAGIQVQRYKGLGEMNASQLWETTMDPAHRTLKQITVNSAEDADSTFSILMGDDVAPRRAFIETNAHMAVRDV